MAARSVPPQPQRDNAAAVCRPARDRLRVTTCALAALLVFSPLAGGDALAAPVKTQVSGTVANGFARIVFTAAQEMDADVRLANGILVVTFKTPVSVNVGLLAGAMGGYVGAVRSDPDGGAVRLALVRKVRVNTMAAGNRFYVDLLPEGWSGTLPGLPQEVIDELAARAREAERKLRQQQQSRQQHTIMSGRVRVATLPTLTRYTFELPAIVPAASARQGDRLTVTFQSPIKFDLTDVRAALPASISAIDAEQDESRTRVHLALVGNVAVTSFREDGAFVVDLSTADGTAGEKPAADGTAKPQPPAQPAAKQATAAPATGTAGKAVAATTIPQAKVADGARPASKLADASHQSAGEIAAGTPHAPPVATAPAEKPAPAVPIDAKAEPPAASAAPARAGPGAPVLQSADDPVRLVFPFQASTAAAIFRRADALWLVFDTALPIEAQRLRDSGGEALRAVTVMRSGPAQVVRMKLTRPRLVRAALDGSTWVVTLGAADSVAAPLTVVRAEDSPLEAAVAFQKPGRLHRLQDPDLGDTLLVVTGAGPVRGLGTAQEFVEFRSLPSTQGIVLEPLADDLTVSLEPERVRIGRPGGLTLSAGASPAVSEQGLASFRPAAFDPQTWGFDQQADLRERQAEFIAAAAAAPEGKRTAARLSLARFYMARGLYAEAKGVLDLTIESERDDDEVATGMVMRSVANLANGHPEAALKELSDPAIGTQQDAELWRGIALARLGRFAEARQKLGKTPAAAARLPVEFQRVALVEAFRSAIETGNTEDATRLLGEFEVVGITPETKPAVALMSGRLAEMRGRTSAALSAYEVAADAADQPTAAQAQLRLLMLRHTLKQLTAEQAIIELERLTAAWRGDDTELAALEFLARLYTEAGRFRDAFHAMRAALASDSRSEVTRRIQSAAAATFENLFLGERADAMPAIESLAIYYDFRMLTPPGRRGDEMIRRLAERLVAIDLLPQASELLQHQVDHRLQGAARAQVATKLAMIYLMDHRSDRALQVLRATRMAEIPHALRSQRLLLEARALSDTGRHDLALEIIAEQPGHEVMRLRVDILWAARRWGPAAEEIERLYDLRWKDFKPLQPVERNDVLRAVVGYALAPDPIGLERFRQKYAAKMVDGPDARIFNVIAAPDRTRGDEFEAVAKAASAVDTLDTFLGDLRAKYPDAKPISSTAAQPRG